jgi:hypothetical protein
MEALPAAKCGLDRLCRSRATSPAVAVRTSWTPMAGPPVRSLLDDDRRPAGDVVGFAVRVGHVEVRPGAGMRNGGLRHDRHTDQVHVAHEAQQPRAIVIHAPSMAVSSIAGTGFCPAATTSTCLPFRASLLQAPQQA